jgi:predicted transcriptional regulator
MLYWMLCWIMRRGNVYEERSYSKCNQSMEYQSKGETMSKQVFHTKQDLQISKKLLRTLRSCKRDTDIPPGMYKGTSYDCAPGQLLKLMARGFVTGYQPHNPIHNYRYTITEKGRELIEAIDSSEGG